MLHIYIVFAHSSIRKKLIHDTPVLSLKKSYDLVYIK